jgi:hypothetical protein
MSPVEGSGATRPGRAGAEIVRAAAPIITELTRTWPASLQGRTHQRAYDGGAEDRAPWSGTLHEFKLDALNLIVLLELNGGALWLDGARADEDRKTIGPAPHPIQSRRFDTAHREKHSDGRPRLEN